MSNPHAPDLLAAIVASTRTALAVRESLCPIAELGRRQTRTPAGPGFEAALAGAPAGAGPFRVIAECKRRSPSRGILRDTYDPAAHARSYALAGAAAISVLTEPSFFDGRLEHLRAVRAAVDLPILRKDFVISEYQLVEAAVNGADAILLIVGALTDAELRHLSQLADTMRLAALVEVHDPFELQRAADAGAKVIGVNSRNLRTLRVDPAVLDAMAARVPAGVIGVAESGIRSRADLERLTTMGYDAFLVGERLITQPDPGAALQELEGLSPCG